MPDTIAAYTEVSICNLALQEVGRGGQIAAMDEQSQSARMAVLRYPFARDAVQRAYDWNFCAARARLTENPVKPPFEFSNAYDLPDDCVQLRKVVCDDGCLWKVEGKQLLINHGSEVDIRYTKRVTDPALFDTLFVSALAARIAADIATTLTESSTRAEGLWRVYQAKLAEARKRDAQEDQPDPFPVGSWIESRYT